MLRRVVMSVTQHHPLDVIELAPEGLLLPLDVALTDAQHRDIQTEHARKVGPRSGALWLGCCFIWCVLVCGAAPMPDVVGGKITSMVTNPGSAPSIVPNPAPTMRPQLEEALAAAAAQQAEEDEARRIALLREGYEAAVPDEIKERVTAAVDKELVRALRFTR